jgi:hypothetical protein
LIGSWVERLKLVGSCIHLNTAAQFQRFVGGCTLSEDHDVQGSSAVTIRADNELDFAGVDERTGSFTKGESN